MNKYILSLEKEIKRLSKINFDLNKNLEEYDNASVNLLNRIKSLTEQNKRLLEGVEYTTMREDFEEREHNLHILLIQERQANDALKDYLYFAAHDSEKNFSAVGIAFHYLKEKISGNKQLPEIPYLLQYQSAAIDAFRIFINNLFSIGKIEAQRIDHVIPKKIVVKDFFKEIVSIIDTDAVVCGGRTISLICTPSMPDIIISDETMLRQIAANLLMNAKERTVGTVLLQLSGDKTNFVVMVMNQGDAIPDDLLKKIFDRNFTTNRTTGKGVGLTVTKSLVQALGGEIVASNQPNIGPVFTVSLPLNFCLDVSE